MKKYSITILLALIALTGWAQVNPTTALLGSWSGKLKVGAASLTWPVGYDKNAKQKPTVVLMVTGSGQQNLTAIERLLPKSKHNLIKEYPGLNHLFQHCTTGLVTEYSEIEETISPEVLSDIANWINSLK